jgi:hypothetical protein
MSCGPVPECLIRPAYQFAWRWCDYDECLVTNLHPSPNQFTSIVQSPTLFSRQITYPTSIPRIIVRLNTGWTGTYLVPVYAHMHSTSNLIQYPRSHPAPLELCTYLELAVPTDHAIHCLDPSRLELLELSAYRLAQYS